MILIIILEIIIICDIIVDVKRGVSDEKIYRQRTRNGNFDRGI